MSPACRHACFLALALATMAGVATAPAFAFPEFEKQFKAAYVKEGSPLAAAVETAKCNVCHVGKSKKERNAYGDALAELLDKGDKKDTAKIQQALEAVAKQPSKVDGKTFGDLISDGRLPAE